MGIGNEKRSKQSQMEVFVKEENKMTVFTPKAIERMVTTGHYRRVALKDLLATERRRQVLKGLSDKHDSVYYFRYPSPDVINEVNGDGDFIEVYSCGLATIDTEVGVISVTPDTVVYIR